MVMSHHSRRCSPRLLALVASLLLVALAGGAAAQPPTLGPLIPTWGPNGAVGAMTIEGSTLYVGGRFDQVGPPTGPFAIVDAASDTTFAAGARLPRNLTALVDDGAGGWFGALQNPGFVLDGQPLVHILPDGSVDGGWAGPTFTGGLVFRLAFEGGRLYAAGTFKRAGGAARGGLAAIDPATGTVLLWDAALTVFGQLGFVEAIGTAPGRIYVAGTFDAAGGVPRAGFAVLDPLTGAPLAPALPPSLGSTFISAIVVAGSRVYMYGGCRAGGFVICAYDLDLNPVTGWTFPALRYPPLVATATALYAIELPPALPGGTFRVSKLDATTGAELSWQAPTVVSDRIVTMEAAGNRLYLGGEFTAVNGVGRTRIAAVDATTGQLESWAPRVGGSVAAIVPSGSRVAFGGSFNSVGGIAKKNLVAIDLRTGLPATPGAPDVDFQVNAMTRLGDVLVVAGRWPFTIPSTSGPNVTAFSMSTATPYSWSLETNGGVGSLVADGSRLYLGGDFSLVGGAQRLNVAAIDLGTAQLTSWNPSPDRPVAALALSAGALYAAGAFATVPGYERRGVVAWDTASGQVLPFNPGTRSTGSTTGFGFYRDRVALVGDRSGGYPASPDLVEWVDRISGAPGGPASNSAVAAFSALQVGDVIYAVGPGAAGIPSVAAIDAPTGLVQERSVGPDGSVSRIAVSGDYIVVAGEFRSASGAPAANIAAYGALRAGAPQRMTATITNTTVSLGWQAGGPPMSTAFQVEAGTVAGGVDVGVFNVGPANQVSGVLPPGTYFTRVRGIGANGPGAASSEVIVTVPSTSTPPNAPGPLSASVAGGLVTLNWGAASGNATTYVIEAGTASGLTNIGALPTGVLDTTFSTPAPAGTYFVRVRAANASGQSLPTNEVVVVVP
jgi:trimeric autotransporter adhesin